MTVATSKSSMIIDGIAASEAIDSSGEILDVKGCDISDFESGVGLLNYEHRGDDATGASGNDIVGKIVYARKIFKKDDCEDKRQEAYWDHVKLPFIYIRGRLFDGSDHAGAKALAAAIRDAVTHNEPILARFSIEGSTLKKEGQRLARTIARKVAVTFKPANKSAISGLVSDPNSSKPITEKQAEKSLLSQLLEESAVKSERPGEQRLGGHTMEYSNLEMTEDPAKVLKTATDKLKGLLKTMTGGMGDAAPSTLTGGAALQREDFRLHKDKLKNDLRAAVRDLPDNARNSKSEMLKFFKFKLPEVNESFLDHFTDLIDDVRTRQVGDWVEKTMHVWDAVKKAEARGEAKAPKAPKEVPPVPEKPEYVPRPEATPPTEVPAPTARGIGLTTEGQLLSQKVSQQKAKLTLYDYGQDAQFMSVLHADDPAKSPDLDAERRAQIIKYVHQPWQRAAASWLTLNKMAMVGELPASVIAHSAIFAAMSPNTSVPMQELYFGHYMDFSRKYGNLFLDPKGVDPKDAEHFHKWLNKTTPPEFFKEFYLQNYQEKGGIDVGERKQTLNPNATLEKRPQGVPLLNYHRFHPLMTALVKEVKDDGRAYTDYIMQHKEEHGATSMMPGFGPKLARYQALLMGQGNVIVPDRHFLRSLFNLSENDPMGDYVASSLAPTKGERLLRGIDHHFNQKSPGVKKVLETWPDHFEGREMQANALGFWLQWLCQPHYNALRGVPTDNLNMGTAHDPYFKAVRDTLETEGIPHDLQDLSGLYLKKHTEVHGRQFGAPLPARIARATKKIEEQYGEAASSLFFYSFGVPALMAHERMNEMDETRIRKMESLAIEVATLFKASGLTGQNPVQQALEPVWPPQEQAEVAFQGQPVKVGAATVYATPRGEHAPQGRKMAIVGKAPPSEGSPQGDWIMIPHEKLGIHGADDIERWGMDGTAEIHQEPIFSEVKPSVVHKALHVPPHYLHKGFQQDLVHGLDMSPDNGLEPPGHFQSGISDGQWKTLPNGKLGYVKWHTNSPTGMPSSSHAEALYHNAMHFLGLGDYTAPTTLFRHPEAPDHKDDTPDDWMVASQGVENPSHYSGSREHKETLHKLYRTGELDKIGLANRIMGNRDRHSFNYLFGGEKGDKLYMIDHGHSLPRHDTPLLDHYPHYMHVAKEHGKREGSYNDKLHPAAKSWLESLDPVEFEKFLGKHQTPPSVAHAAAKRLRAMQDYVKQEPNAHFDEVQGWPAEDHGQGSDHWRDAGDERAKRDPEFAERHGKRIQEGMDRRTQLYNQRDQLSKLKEGALQNYLAAAERGEDPEPFQFVIDQLGSDKAEGLLFTNEGPNDSQKAIKDFNQRIRNLASIRLRDRKHLREGTMIKDI